jgi:hypothetical protein
MTGYCPNETQARADFDSTKLSDVATCEATRHKIGNFIRT